MPRQNPPPVITPRKGVITNGPPPPPPRSASLAAAANANPFRMNGAVDAARWGVVATVAEPAALVLAFVACCLDRGADNVHLFLDVPDPPLLARLRQVARCTVTVCDDDHWRGVPGGRPWPGSQRQRVNLQRAYDTARLPWLLHIDTDEFLFGPADLGARLAALPDNVDFALIETVERVHIGAPDSANIFAGAFRRPTPPALASAIAAADGEAAIYLDRGVTGYVGGKSFFRTGRGLRVEVHTPAAAREDRMARLTAHLILHYDGLTPRGWIDKHRRHMAQQPEWRSFPAHHQYRINQRAAVRAAGSDDRQLAALYAQIKSLDAPRAAALRSAGLLFQADLGIAEAGCAPNPRRAARLRRRRL